MSYEEIDKSIYGNDVFTNGAEGRYTKPKDTVEKKKRIPKVAASTAEEQSYENGHTDEVVKTKKKSRKTHENGEIQNEEQTSEVIISTDGETVVKPKKKRAPKAESNNENIDPIPTGEEEPVRKKKSKTPKSTPIDGESQMIDTSTFNEFDPSTEIPTKVKKPKKHKTPKMPTDPSADPFNDVQTNNTNEYSTNSELNGAYGLAVGDISDDAPQPYPIEAEQLLPQPERSEYEMAIIDAYNDLAAKLNFAEFVGNDQWKILQLPKSARTEPKSRIRRILPGGKEDKPEGKSSGGKATPQKGGLFTRFRSGINILVRDENNLLFGEPSNYELAYYDDDDDGVDTDDLHRYAQKLRELEDTDREVNPEFLVLRDGKTVYAVHEADAEGKMTLSTRKPIYDRSVDQGPDDEPAEKKKLLARLRHPFARNKDKDSKGNNSPKSSTGTPDTGRKRNTKKSNHKMTDDDMATIANSEPSAD